MEPNFSKIIANNSQETINDIEEAVTVMVYASSNGLFLETTKEELYDVAQFVKIRYMMTREIFDDERLTFVVL